MKRMSRPTLRTLLVIATIVLPGLAAAQQLKQTFPRIGAYEISSSFKVADPNYRARLAKHDILILGMWRNWGQRDIVSGEILSIRDVVVDIRREARRIGNENIIIAKYTAINEATSKPRGSSTERWDKLHSEVGPGYPVNNDWWARTKDGAHTSSYPGQWHVNMTEHVRPDANGDYFTEWAVETDYKAFFRDIPEFDMWFIDNWFYRPRVEPDWDGDGRNDDRNDPRVRREFRQGYVNALNRIKRLAPGMLVMGNVDGQVGTGSGMLTEPEYKGKIAALYEAALGLDHSAEEWGGWETMMTQYRTTASNAKDNLIIMVAHGDADDFKLMRYGLASCLMDNGYYYYTSMEDHYQSALWFDEFDVNLGRAVDPPQYSAWQDGVYRRRFENGMALVNPKGNGTRTVRIEPGYRRIDGSQDRRVNNGQPADSVTLAPRDGIILVRTDATENRKRPKPPVLSTQ